MIKIWIELDKYNRITGFSFIKNDKMKEIETDLEIDINNFKNYILKNGELIFSELPPKPTSLHDIFNGVEWETSATQEEIDDYNWKEEVRFYNQELEFASKAVAELKCDIISQEDFEDVRVYMQSIDPYAQTYKSRDRKTRPDIFNRYQ